MKPIAIATLLVFAAFSGGAAAHGQDGHSKPAAAVKKEQQAWGIAGDVKQVNRTVTLRMTDDMRFTPDLLEAKLGETIRLVVHNSGQARHELVIGTQQELDAHAALMMKFPNMEHDEPHMAHVDPGQKGEIVWTFNRAGEFSFACLIAGHYQAGMMGKIKVKP